MNKKENGALGRLIFLGLLAGGPVALLSAAAGGATLVNLANAAVIWFGTEYVLGRTFLSGRKNWDHDVALCSLLLVVVGTGGINYAGFLVRVLWAANPEATFFTLFGAGILAVWALLGWTVNQVLQMRWWDREDLWLPRGLGFFSLPILAAEMVSGAIVSEWIGDVNWIWGGEAYRATTEMAFFGYANSVVLQLVVYAFVLGLLALASQIKNDCRLRQTA